MLCTLHLNGTSYLYLQLNRRERISSLEQQLAIEVEQRQQAEALNAQLHQQIVEARRQLSEKQPAASAASATNVTPDFTLVSKEHLHSLLQE